MKLPKLPNPASVLQAKYTADQMREYAAKVAEQAQRQKCEELAAKIEQMPFGDTAASFAQWIREQA